MMFNFDVTIQRTCPFCGAVSEVTVNIDAYIAWQEGTILAQDAFPELSAAEREVLISGICYECQEEIFEEGEDDPEYYEDDVDEMGFNPYMGDYDFDC